MTTPLRPVYDFLIQGHCLATRLLAVALAKEGEKVLLVVPAAPLSLRLPASPLFERWRTYLGLKPCLHAAEPLQIMTEQSRLELHGLRSLTEELSRELPEDADTLEELLHNWQQAGMDLLESLCTLPPMIGNLKVRTRFRLRSLTKIASRHLSAPVRRIWPQNLSAQADALLQTLIEGMATAPLAQMTVAEVYLAAFSALQGETVDFNRLLPDLEQRYAQFHGQTVEQTQIGQLEYRSDSWQLTTNDQHSIRIQCLIDSRLTPVIPTETSTARAPIVYRQHGSLGHPLPPSYQQQLLISGQPTIDLRVSARDAEAKLSSRSATDPANIQALLEHLFPFRQATASVTSAEEPARCRRMGLVYAVQQRLHQRHGHYVCDPLLQCPRLDGTGDLLLAEALHHQL